MKSMTIEELREIVKEKGFPIKLEAIDPEDVVDISIHVIVGERVAYTTENGHLATMSARDLRDYKSHKQPKIETLYECWSDYGICSLYFEDGRTAVFSRKCKSNLNYSEALTRKTGRTVKLDMETWEIVND